MTQVATYSQPHHSELFSHRPLAPTSGALTSAHLYPIRGMAYNNGYDDNNNNHHHYGGYYAPPPVEPVKQPSEERSSSVSSTSSSTSHAASYNTAPSHHGSISRTLSPASAISDSGTSVIATHPKTHYPAATWRHSHAPHAQAAAFPSQYLPAQATSSPPAYSPAPTPRQQFPQPPQYLQPPQFSQPQHFSQPPQFSQAPSYSSYPVGTLPQHPSPFSSEPYPTPVFAPCATADYHSLPPAPSYQPSPMAHHMPMVKAPEAPKPIDLLWLVRKLPVEVVSLIRKELGWFQCWKLSTLRAELHPVFRQHFSPHSFTHAEKDAGVLAAERYGGDEPEESDAPSTRRSEGKFPPWLGCYHCFKLKPLWNFERYKHCNSLKEEDSTPAARSQRSSMSPRQSSSPTPPRNPHYDPNLTRSNLKATASITGRLGCAGTTSRAEPAETNLDVRRRTTYNLKRFCLDCGVRNGWYEPGDLIEVHEPEKPGQAVWVCRCRKLRIRPDQNQCRDCGQHTPLSTQVVRIRR